ncbi:MAG: hypothetical protein Q8Q30_03135 [Candidatus Woesebacteria bacterium]|nr:hypothetical protein [Candidatus Woesebacteria bacterium]
METKENETKVDMKSEEEKAHDRRPFPQPAQYPPIWEIDPKPNLSGHTTPVTEPE